MIKLGLIGGGYWGKNLIREFNNIKVLHTICDINKDALINYQKLYPNIETTKDWENVLNNKDINAVCIALPAELHYKFAKKSLLSDKDVYVEKPITLDIEEAKELIEIAKEKKKNINGRSHITLSSWNCKNKRDDK
jgi:UDP-2-acetamido-3-amino-2,3-dideoxy-glucuronate N-acetyltransferase